MRHRNIRHDFPVDKEMVIKSIADLLFQKDGNHKDLMTKKRIRDHLSWITWYNGYGSIEDQPDCIRDYYPQATKIYNELYPKE